MKINKTQSNILMLVVVPAYVIGMFSLILYFLKQISGDTSKNILGIILACGVIYSIERIGKKITVD